MSNVKQFHISGIIPFDAWTQPEMKDFLAFAVMPHSGIELKMNEAGYRQNTTNNGQCAVIRFTADGVSGMRLKSFGKLIIEVFDSSEHGYIDECDIYDLQNDCNLYHGKGNSKILFEARKWVEMGY